MSLAKRKSVDENCVEPDKKKLKEFSDVEGGAIGHQNGAVVYDTQEYDLEDSDGFEFYPESTLKPESSEDTEESHDETITKLQREKTEEYSLNNESESAEKNEIPSTTKTSMEKIVSVQKDAELIKVVIPESDIETIYDKILRKRSVKNRVDVVTNELIENGENKNTSAGSTVSDSSSDVGIFEEIAEVLIVRPNADPNRVYDLLDQLNDTENRVEKVLSKLTSADDLTTNSVSETSASKSEVSNVEKTGCAKGGDPFSDPEFKKNPLYNDLRTLRKVLPEKDPNEIYAFLEAHYDKANRVQIVIDELTKTDSQESLSLPKVDSFEDFDRGKAPLTTVDKFHADLNELKEIFRDCDPNYLYNKLESRSAETNRVHIIAAELFEDKNYPKLKDVKEREEKEDLKDKIVNMKFDMKTFLKKFANPVEYFQDTSRILSQNYKDHVLIYMKNTYPVLKVGYIKKVLEQQNYHLSPTMKIVDQELQLIADRPSKKKRVTPSPRFELLDYPENPDEPFFQELMFCKHRQEIKDYIAEQTRMRNLKIETARKNDELLECGCCFDDECLFEEMAACADGHIFCKECIRRSSEAAIGEGRTKFLCLTGTCELEFPLTVLQELLPATMFSLALRKMQEEELRQADIPDLVSCPFCSFATIMPDQDDKIFKCLNQECLKESCRLCKELNHIPLRCNEVEKRGATNMRTYIETKVSEAMLRICPKCKKRFYKIEGCNKMTCTCGTSMCYVCRTPYIDYSHFDNSETGGCSIDTDVKGLHDQEMMEAAMKAKEEYLRDHPDQDPQLDTDALINKLKGAWNDEMSDGYGDDDDNDDYDD